MVYAYSRRVLIIGVGLCAGTVVGLGTGSALQQEAEAATQIEYGLIAALVSVAAIGASSGDQELSTTFELTSTTSYALYFLTDTRVFLCGTAPTDPWAVITFEKALEESCDPTQPTGTFTITAAGEVVATVPYRYADVGFPATFEWIGGGETDGTWSFTSTEPVQTSLLLQTATGFQPVATVDLGQLAGSIYVAVGTLPDGTEGYTVDFEATAPSFALTDVDPEGWAAAVGPDVPPPDGPVVGSFEARGGTFWDDQGELIPAPPLAFDVDVKPGSYPNSVNLGSQGGVPVAILSSPEFDALQIDPATVTLEGADVLVRGKSNLMSHAEDVNGDGLLDLVVQVDTQSLEVTADGVVRVEGQTWSGQWMSGSDFITVVP